MFIEKKSKPQIGDIKTKVKFLLLPRETDKKFAWLCRCKLTYKRTDEFLLNNNGDYFEFMHWQLIDIERA